MLSMSILRYTHSRPGLDISLKPVLAAVKLYAVMRHVYGIAGGVCSEEGRSVLSLKWKARYLCDEWFADAAIV